jgi:hypothetical protein
LTQKNVGDDLAVSTRSYDQYSTHITCHIPLKDLNPELAVLLKSTLLVIVPSQGQLSLNEQPKPKQLSTRQFENNIILNTCSCKDLKIITTAGAGLRTGFLSVGVFMTLLPVISSF